MAQQHGPANCKIEYGTNFCDDAISGVHINNKKFLPEGCQWSQDRPCPLTRNDASLGFDEDDEDKAGLELGELG